MKKPFEIACHVSSFLAVLDGAFYSQLKIQVSLRAFIYFGNVTWPVSVRGKLSFSMDSYGI